MNSRKLKKQYYIYIIIVLLIIALAIYFLIKLNLKNNNDTETNDNSSINQELNSNHIRLDEELKIDKYIKNLETAKCNDVRIIQEDDKLKLEIYIINESKTEIIPSTELTINIIDKDRKTIFTENVQMEEIKNNFGYTKIELEFNIEEPVIVYDIEIVANS